MDELKCMLLLWQDRPKFFKQCWKRLSIRTPKDNNWDTPLHSAAEGGHYKICKLIIDAGGISDKNPSNKSNETPLELATSNNHTEVGLLIRERRNWSPKFFMKSINYM